MIVQAILDFFRDVVVNWINGTTTILSGLDPNAAGAAIGAVAGPIGNFLALFIAPSWWTAITTAWLLWLGVWLTTGAIAIIARRGSGSSS